MMQVGESYYNSSTMQQLIMYSVLSVCLYLSFVSKISQKLIYGFLQNL